MEVVGFSASILTFVGAAITVSKSIHNTLSAIKDGPEIIASLNHEISQLESILQRLSEVFSSIATPTDRPELEKLVKKCKSDLVGFETSLRQLDVSGADGRRGRLWRKLKFCLEEKDLDQIRHVVRGHINAFTLHLVIIQTRQQTLLTNILPTLQQIQQGVAAIQVSNTSATITQVDSSSTSTRATELEDTKSHISQQTTLHGTIARLMKLVEKRPCIVDSEDSKEIVDDLERLLQFFQDEVLSEKRGGGDGDRDEDVSQEVKLFTSLIVSSPSLRINQNEPRNSLEATKSQFAVFQERKRKEIHTNDAVITVATTKRREKLLLVSKDIPANELYGRGFRGSLTLKSKTKKKMVTLSVQQGQLLFDRFTGLLPRVMVCNILPNDSLVFEVASNGSVEDLMRLIVGNEASLDDHDEDGWSLLHHAVGNLPTFKFLIEQGLDVTEIAQDKVKNDGTQTDLLIIANNYEHDHDIEFSEILLHAGADPTIQLQGRASLIYGEAAQGDMKGRDIVRRALSITPFVFSDIPAYSENPISAFCHAWTLIPGKDLNPEQERNTLDLFISRGYKPQPGNQNSGLRGFLRSWKRSFSKALERRDLLIYLISTGDSPFDGDLQGPTLSYAAYGGMCKPCSLSQPSLVGDLWDSVLDIHGYDVSSFRQDYQRIASYKNGYTREIFEQLWSGREERCPYWDDEPGPKISNKKAQLEFESKLGLGLCTYCWDCLDHACPCHYCGVCLLVFRYLCYKTSDPDHEHDRRCPRIRVGYLEECENCGRFEFRPKVDSDSGSDDGMSDYLDSSKSSDETGWRKSPSHKWVAECCYCRFEEVSSDDESVGGTKL